MAVYQIVPSQGKVFDWLREHKTDILTYGGIGMMTGSIVAASIGTANMIREKEEEEKMNTESPLVRKVWNRSKHYAIATGLWASGGYCIHKSHGMLKTENAVLANTITAWAAGTMAYRQRWKDKVGEEEEKKIFLDEKTEEVVDENGKKKKVKTTNLDRSISTERYFDRWSSWAADDTGDMDYDARVIDNVQCVLNNELTGNPERYVLLSRAYDLLRLFTVNEFGQRVDDRSVAGQVGGWIWDKKHPNGDNTIIIKRTKTTRKLDDGRVVPTWLLEFNIDGNIMGPAKERGLLK